MDILCNALPDKALKGTVVNQNIFSFLNLFVWESAIQFHLECRLPKEEKCMQM